MAVKTAVVTVAGSASRMWPSSKVHPKELFPLGRMPAIVYLVWELEDAGVERVILVVNPRTEPHVKALLAPEVEPPANVAAYPEVERFQATLRALTFECIHQVGPYGNGTPLRSAAPLLGDETVIYAFGDDIVFGENTSRGLVEVHRRCGLPVLATQEVPAERVHQFGIVEAVRGPDADRVVRLVEKPAPGVTSSRLAVYGRYLLTPDVRGHLDRTSTGKGGELWLTDALLGHQAAGGEIGVFTLATGRWVTVGDPRGYAEAVALAAALQR